MNKVNILVVVIILLLFSLLGLSIKYIKLSEKYNRQQYCINNAFKSSIGKATSNFAIDLGSSDIHYNEAMISIASSYHLILLTTYEFENDKLDIALNDLYQIMKQNEYKESIILKSKLIHDNLSRLWENPADKEATDDMIKLTNEMRQGI